VHIRDNKDNHNTSTTIMR